MFTRVLRAGVVFAMCVAAAATGSICPGHFAIPLSGLSLRGLTTMYAKPTRPRGPVYSTLADDPEMEPLVGEFVDGLADRVELLVDRLQSSDHGGLCRLAHQMAGAAGSYGFQEITVDAAALETTLREGRSEVEIAAAVNALIDICRRARAGADSSPAGPSAVY